MLITSEMAEKNSQHCSEAKALRDEHLCVKKGFKAYSASVPQAVTLALDEGNVNHKRERVLLVVRLVKVRIIYHTAAVANLDPLKAGRRLKKLASDSADNPQP